MESKLFIYGTVWNSSEVVTESVQSIRGLNPQLIVVIDNYSKDGTYEKLKKMDGVFVKQARCNRGEGRNLALKIITDMCNDDDMLLYVDLDTIYKDKFIKIINDARRLIRPNELYVRTMLSFAKVNKTLNWKPLNYGEDWERLARAKRAGIHLFTMEAEYSEGRSLFLSLDNDFFRNRPEKTNIVQREYSYRNSFLLTYVRIFKQLIDYQRGICFKSFKDYTKMDGIEKYPSYYRSFLILPYVLAKIIGCFCYDSKIDNLRYISFENLERRDSNNISGDNILEDKQ